MIFPFPATHTYPAQWALPFRGERNFQFCRLSEYLSISNYQAGFRLEKNLFWILLRKLKLDISRTRARPANRYRGPTVWCSSRNSSSVWVGSTHLLVWVAWHCEWIRDTTRTVSSVRQRTTSIEIITDTFCKIFGVHNLCILLHKKKTGSLAPGYRESSQRIEDSLIR